MPSWIGLNFDKKNQRIETRACQNSNNGTKFLKFATIDPNTSLSQRNSCLYGWKHINWSSGLDRLLNRAIRYPQYNAGRSPSSCRIQIVIESTWALDFIKL